MDGRRELGFRGDSDRILLSMRSSEPNEPSKLDVVATVCLPENSWSPGKDSSDGTLPPRPEREWVSGSR